MRLTFWPTVFLVPGLALLIALGVWQLQRLDQKSELLARIETGLAAEPALLPATVSDPDAWDYRRVRVEGEFLHEREMFLSGRTYGGRVGLHVVTPLRRTDAAGSPAVLVDRGWIPLEAQDRAARTEGQPSGPVTVSGIARRPLEPGWMQPDNEPDANLWFWIDTAAMAEAAAVGPVPDLIIEADVAGSSLPIGGQTRLDIPNNHLQYAVTWFAFAAVLLIIYVLYHRRPRDRGPSARPSDGSEPE